MPTPAATPKNVAPAKIHQGPADLWYVPTAVVPNDATKVLTLFTDGTPDSSVHAGCKHFGAKKGPTTVSLSKKAAPIEIEEAGAPVDDVITAVAMDIEAELAQLDYEMIQHALGFGTYSAGPPVSITFGTQLVPDHCGIAAIWKDRSTANLYHVALLYRVTSESVVALPVSRGKETTYKVKFSGRADTVRTPGQDVGILHQVTISA